MRWQWLNFDTIDLDSWQYEKKIPPQSRQLRGQQPTRTWLRVTSCRISFIELSNGKYCQLSSEPPIQYNVQKIGIIKALKESHARAHAGIKTWWQQRQSMMRDLIPYARARNRGKLISNEISELYNSETNRCVLIRCIDLLSVDWANRIQGLDRNVNGTDETI